jgi:hypothetical protein
MPFTKVVFVCGMVIAKSSVRLGKVTKIKITNKTNKIMKTLKYIAAIAITCASLGLAPRASAIIDLGQTDSSPANLANEVVRLQGQIDLYNAANDPDLPDATLVGAVQVQASSDGLTSIDIDITGWTYIKLAWDGVDQFYFVGDETGVLTFNSTVFNNQGQPQALSHYALFNPTGVPDGGTTVMLLGAALSALGMARRFLKC